MQISELVQKLWIRCITANDTRLDSFRIIVYSVTTLCLKHTNQKSEKERNHTDFSFEVQVLQAEKSLLLAAVKVVQRSRYRYAAVKETAFSNTI
jgi:hypothetical protein